MAVIDTLEIRFQADLGNLGAELDGLAQRIGGLGTALENGRIALTASAAGLIQSVASALTSGAAMSTAPMDAGNAMVRNFAQGINSAGALATDAAKRVTQAANFTNSGAVSAARSAGAALGEGFASGISSKYSAVMQAANRIANAAVSRIRSALSIHSPSKVSFELGNWFGEGFAGGVRATLNQVEQSAAALSVGAQGALVRERVPVAAGDEGLASMVGGAVRTAMGQMNIEIPLYVDAIKLGEASIRGINQVTRNTGRVMLEI